MSFLFFHEIFYYTVRLFVVALHLLLITPRFTRCSTGEGHRRDIGRSKSRWGADQALKFVNREAIESRRSSNILGLVPDRGRVTDHPKSASNSSKLPTFTTLPELVTTGGLCVAPKRSILHAGASSGSRMLSISTEETSYSSFSLP